MCFAHNDSTLNFAPLKNMHNGPQMNFEPFIVKYNGLRLNFVPFKLRVVYDGSCVNMVPLQACFLYIC